MNYNGIVLYALNLRGCEILFIKIYTEVFNDGSKFVQP